MGDIKSPDYEGPDRRKSEREIESKVTIKSRSADRAHSTESAVDQDAITDINVAPLVDVALVLVIIFMAVSPFVLQAGIMVSESKAGASKGKASVKDNIQITLSDQNVLRLNGKKIDLEDLHRALKKALPKTKDGLVTVQAEKSNYVGQVVGILDVAKQAGAKKVAILNKLEEDSKKK